jgi:signal transduction histidine kinase
MVIAPGNWVRMNVHAKDSNLVFSDYLVTVCKTSLHLIKLLFFKVHYFLAAGFLLWAISQQMNITSKKNIRKTNLVKRILYYALITVGLCLGSILLNTYAVGDRMELRAFNHINLFCLLFIGSSIYEFATNGFYKKLHVFAVPVSLLFVIVCNIYCSFKSVPELRAYEGSVNTRMEKLEILRIDGNRETIKLNPLHVAEFHSVDDVWKLVIPKFTPRALLKPNEISNSTGNFYNQAYRKYYKLDFDVITDLSYEL